MLKVTPGGTISPFAGGASPGFAGDGGPATSALLSAARGLAVDAGGNVYIADGNNARVRRVTPGGTITTVAGGGASNPGDGGPATSAVLGFPYDVEVDATGRLLIGDVTGERIRRVDASGTISTVVGTGASGVAAENSPAATAQTDGPEQIVAEPNGDILYAEFTGGRVRRIAASTGLVTTIAGGGAASPGDGGAATDAALAQPSGLARDAQGNLYVSEIGTDRVRALLGVQGGPAGPTGPAGPAGPQGAAGTPGTAGARGAPGRLVVAAFAAKVAGGRVTVRYAATGAAAVRLTVRRGHGRTITVSRGRARAGVNAITWNGRLAGHRAPAGAYTVSVTATIAGHSTSSHLRVVLR